MRCLYHGHQKHSGECDMFIFVRFMDDLWSRWLCDEASVPWILKPLMRTRHLFSVWKLLLWDAGASENLEEPWARVPYSGDALCSVFLSTELSTGSYMSSHWLYSALGTAVWRCSGARVWYSEKLPCVRRPFPEDENASNRVLMSVSFHLWYRGRVWLLLGSWSWKCPLALPWKSC